MAVWLTEDNKVILRNGKVYTGDRKPCGYVILQKCVFTAGSQSASPSYKRTKEIIQISDFCKYPDATTWFDANSSEYPTSGEESYTLLKPSDVTGDKVPWLTCNYTANDAAAVECPTYDPAMYYVHSKCDADDKNPETGKLSCIVSTKDEEKGYTLYGGPYTYSKARDEAAACSGLPCSTGADYNFVVMSNGCDCSKPPARHKTIIQSYAVGSPEPSGTKLEGPFGTYAKAVEAANKVYKCACTLYFGWNTCKSLCGDHNAGETINYAVYGPFTYNPTGLYEKAAGPYSTYSEVEAAMEAKEKITCKCSDLKWYLYVNCYNGQYETFIKNDADGFADYELEGEYNTRDEAVAAAAKYKGACSEKYCVYLYCSPSTCKTEMKSAKVSATYSGTVTDYVNKLNEGDSKWSPYSTYSSYTDWVSEDVAKRLVSQWQPYCCTPAYKREDGGGYTWYYAFCRDGDVVRSGFYNHVPKCTAAEYIAMENASGKCYADADEFGGVYTPISAVAVTVVSGESKRGFFRADATVKFGSCPSTAALLLSDTPDDLQ